MTTKKQMWGKHITNYNYNILLLNISFNNLLTFSQVKSALKYPYMYLRCSILMQKMYLHSTFLDKLKKI